MSISILAVLQTTGISAAYFSVTLLLPWLFLRKRLAGFGSVPVRFMAYFLIGHFYIINLVYVLQLLHISCWLTLAAGTFAPFFVTGWLRYRDSAWQRLEEMLSSFLLVLGGEMGRKTLLLRAGKRISRSHARAAKKRSEYIRANWLDILLICGLIVLLLYMYGTNAVKVYGYGASDMVLHNYWINEMGRGNIFVDGVYPFGLHCLLYYLHAVFGFHVNVVLRLFYVVQTVVIHLVLLAFLRSVCKSKYAPYIGTAAYILSNRLYMYTYIRYHATLPQEFGMAFILPAAYFAFAFLQEKVFPPAAAEKKSRLQRFLGFFSGTGNRYLALFAISVSLTLSVHFYDTIIAGLFCIAIGAGFCFRVFRWRYFKRIVAAGIAGLMLAVLPMAAAFVTGTPLQASLNWGMSQWQSSAAAPAVPAGEDGKEGEPDVLDIVLDRMEYYVAEDENTAEMIVWGIGCLFLLGVLWCVFRRADYGAVLVSVSIYMGILAVLQSSAELGLMQLLEVSRYSVYLGYGIPVVVSLCVDGVLYILFKWKAAQDACSFAALLAGCAAVFVTGVRAPVCVSAYESNEAVVCLNNIIRENKGKAWTICSANDERQMIGDYDLGFHYEMIKFLKDMRSYDEDTSITIPTSSVYFFVEKIPLLYRDYITTERPVKKVSRAGAKEPLSEEPGLLPYIGDSRFVTMSHMYFWAQEFKKLYPNEMEVYYETDQFVCYRVKQNEYSLYNFAIDYGYNGDAEER